MKEFYQHSFGDHFIFQTPTLWNTYKGYNYLIAHKNQAYIFDPGELDPIENTLRKNQLDLKAIYLTHHHPDHVGATEALVKKHACPVHGFIGDEKRLPPLDHPFKSGDHLIIAGLKAEVLLLPGHTTGLCAFHFPKMEWLFSNDLLFSLGCGRVFEGSYQQMFESLKQVRSLPNTTHVFPSHEYTLSNLDFALSLFPEDKKLKGLQASIQKKSHEGTPTVPIRLGFEKDYNPFLRWDDEDIRAWLGLESAEDWQVFAKIRQAKDNF